MSHFAWVEYIYVLLTDHFFCLYNLLMNKTRPKIFDFLDASQYLESYYNWRKILDPKFSYSTWALEMNFSSKIILRFIVQKRRNISENSLKLLVANLNFNQDERKYFELLVAYNQAKNSSEKNALGARVVTFQRSMYKQTPISPESAEDVYGPIVLTLLTFNDFKKDSNTLAELLGLSLGDMQRILETLLLKNQIMAQDDNSYSVNFESFKINADLGSLSLKRFHDYWLERSRQAINLPVDLRRFRSLKFALSESEFQEALEKINDFAIQLLSRYHTSELEGRRLYMLENALFPITQKKDW